MVCRKCKKEYDKGKRRGCPYCKQVNDGRWLEFIKGKAGSLGVAEAYVKKERTIYLLLTFVPLVIMGFGMGFAEGQGETFYMTMAMVGLAIVWIFFIYAAVRFGKVLGIGVYNKWGYVIIGMIVYVLPAVIYLLIRSSNQLELLGRQGASEAGVEA